MKIPIRNVYYLLCYAGGHLDEQDLVDLSTLEELERVRDLLGKVLAEGTFRLVRRGIDRGYRETTAEIPGVRGKLEISAIATRAVRARGRTVCTFERFSPDVLHNRILRSTLDLLLRAPGLDPDIRRDVKTAHDKLRGVGVVRLSQKLFSQVQLDRNQRHYRFLLSVCELAFSSTLVDHDSGAVRFQDFREDDATMWKLFEDFVLEFYRREQDRYRVAGQRRIHWHGAGGRTPSDEGLIPHMSADVVLESTERRIILDTKFKGSPLSRYRGATKLHSANLYQILTYLQNREAGRPEGPRHEGVLLYASVGQDLRADVNLQGFRVQARTVDLARTWQEIRKELLEVLEVESGAPPRTDPKGSAGDDLSTRPHVKPVSS